MKNNISGHLAEFIARIFFRLKGYRILEVNYITGKGTKAGEIDFIAQRFSTLVFVEVKKRKDMETALYAIKPSQQKRILRAAENFIAKHKKYMDYNIRFDAVLISFPLKIRHVQNAFSLDY